MEDIESITPQELETIVSTYCERFYPQAMRQTLAALQYTTEAEITNLLQTPMALKKMIERAGTDPIFEPPTLSHLAPLRGGTHPFRNKCPDYPQTSPLTWTQHHHLHIPNKYGYDSDNAHHHSHAAHRSTSGRPCFWPTQNLQRQRHTQQYDTHGPGDSRT